MKPLTIHLAVLCLVVATFSSSTLVAEEEVQVGRYSSVQPLPTPAQEDIFQTVSIVDFPNSVKTVGDAVNLVLSEQGFRIADGDKVDERMHVLLSLPLPKSHRSLGPMTLKSILETLSGPVWYVVQDPVHRLVAFELCTKHSFVEETQE